MIHDKNEIIKYFYFKKWILEGFEGRESKWEETTVKTKEGEPSALRFTAGPIAQQQSGDETHLKIPI
jgi:hypothetical protein